MYKGVSTAVQEERELQDKSKPENRKRESGKKAEMGAQLFGSVIKLPTVPSNSHDAHQHADTPDTAGFRFCGQMDRGGSRNRAISALVQHAKATFDENTRDTRLVAPISPSPQDLIQT